MAQVNLPDELFNRMVKFKQVIEAIIDEPFDADACAEFMVYRAMDFLLFELLGPVDQETLIATIKKLGERHPEQIYSFLAEVWKTGKDQSTREDLRRRIGFHAWMSDKPSRANQQ